MDSLYLTVVGLILLIPWTLLVLVVAGYLRSRWTRRAPRAAWGEHLRRAGRESGRQI